MSDRTLTLEVLRGKDFRWFFLSRSVNIVGSMMTPVTIAFAVLHIDNSSESLGIVLAAQLTANVLCLLFGGVIADRLPRRAVMQTCYLAMAVIQLMMAVSLEWEWATIGSMIVLAALSGGVSAFSMPAQQGLIPQLVPKSQLQQADSLMSFVRNGATFIGPIIGTTLVVVTGPALALAIDGLTFLVAAAMLTKVALPPRKTGARTSMLTELRDGWGEFTSRTWLWVVVAAFGVLNAIHIGAWVVVGPVIAKNNDALGIRGWGFVVGAEAVGMLVMSTILLRWRLRRPLRAGMLGMFCFAIPVLLLGIHPATVPMMAVAFVSGMGTQVFSTGWTVAMMERIPSDVLSRVSSYDMLGSFVAIPVGSLTFGWLASTIDVEKLLIGAGCTYIAIVLATLMVPSIRRLGRVDDDEPTVVKAA
ncbi:MFS transporter [Flexivirga endophytica]|uniref:MFS transporter n=1 Tax=Flexivirga endophytica TaxID=1849103 RepID=A0A916T2R7_9MICO|nr:MFS transporter [Flexivirga endophytica]GGB29695.1 MFS transporter [Flexivirga endophytica]GHB50750.1 MFS transporter [Flexivirga endophytica]